MDSADSPENPSDPSKMGASDMSSSDQDSSGFGSSGANPDAPQNKSQDAAQSAAGQSAAQGGDPNAGSAKPRPGSSLILIPPVTRKTEGVQAGPGADAGGESAAAAGFAKVRTKSFAFKKEWLRYAPPLALGFGLFGAGIATGGQFFGGASSPAPQLAAGKFAAEQTETRHLIKKLSDEVHALQTRVDGLRATPAAAGSEDVRAVKKSPDGLRASLDSTKVQTDAALALVNARLDHLDRHDEARLQGPADAKPVRSDHGLDHSLDHGLDHGLPAVPATTAAIAHPAAAAPHPGEVQTAMAVPPPPKETASPAAAALPPSADAKKKPQPTLVNWVVRDVYRGVALVDGPDGAIEVARGDSIPGAGTVESIERRNGAWVIVTNRGIVASVRD